ncbi:MAG TPA: DUF3175 domain-containing protein [Myxococcaceae bacterium]
MAVPSLLAGPAPPVGGGGAARRRAAAQHRAELGIALAWPGRRASAPLLKPTPFRSAMSMLTFYENRAGRNLSLDRKQAIHQAKDELRKLFGRPTRGARRSGT